MAKYRKKPVVIDAYRPYYSRMPDWFDKALCDLTVRELVTGGFVISTLEGDMRADEGDWIIRGVKGELYPCKDDIFRATYTEEDNSNDVEIQNILNSQLHEYWSKWINFIFEVSKDNDTEGTDYVIPSWAIECWEQRASVPYSELSESETYDLRERTDKIIRLLKGKV